MYDVTPKTTVRKIIVCSKCGGEGHNARTGGKQKDPLSLEDADGGKTAYMRAEAPKQEPVRSLREQVKELFDTGLSVEECFDYLPSQSMAEIRAIYEDIERKAV